MWIMKACPIWFANQRPCVRCLSAHPRSIIPHPHSRFPHSALAPAVTRPQHGGVAVVTWPAAWSWDSTPAQPSPAQAAQPSPAQPSRHCAQPPATCHKNCDCPHWRFFIANQFLLLCSLILLRECASYVIFQIPVIILSYYLKNVYSIDAIFINNKN